MGMIMKKHNKIIGFAKFTFRCLSLVKSIGYLKETGWVKSKIETRIVDSNGSPIPWYTYPCVAFIDERLHSGMTVFEYGSGYSTLYYSSKVNKVVSVESDLTWFEMMKDAIAEKGILNAEVHYIDLKSLSGEHYVKAIKSFGEEFDIVVVDGDFRNECLIMAFERLSKGGVIILDNSSNAGYEEGKDFMKNMGFRHIDFWGLAPIDYRHFVRPFITGTRMC